VPQLLKLRTSVENSNIDNSTLVMKSIQNHTPGFSPTAQVQAKPNHKAPEGKEKPFDLHPQKDAQNSCRSHFNNTSKDSLFDNTAQTHEIITKNATDLLDSARFKHYKQGSKSQNKDSKGFTLATLVADCQPSFRDNDASRVKTDSLESKRIRIENLPAHSMESRSFEEQNDSGATVQHKHKETNGLQVQSSSVTAEKAVVKPTTF
jgi:hypothetical protein